MRYEKKMLRCGLHKRFGLRLRGLARYNRQNSGGRDSSLPVCAAMCPMFDYANVQ